MSDSAVHVTFGGDSSALEASIAQIKAALRSYNSDLAETARAQAKAGESASAEIGEKLLAAAAKVSSAKAQLRDLTSQLRELEGGGANGLKNVAAAAEELGAHGAGPGFFLRELHALGDELTSGRYRQAEGTFLNLASTFLQANTALLPFAAVLAAVGAAIGVVGYKAYEAEAAINSLRLDAASNQFQMSATAAAALRDQLETLANVGASDATAIAKPFLQMGEVGGRIAEMLAPSMKQLAQAMGGDVAKAAEDVAQRFVHLDSTGLQFVESSRAVTSAEKEHFAELLATGQRMQAYSVLIDLTTRSLASLKNQTDLAAAAQSDHVRAIMLATNAGYSFEDAAKMIESAEERARAKIESTNATLDAQRAALLAASGAAETFANAIQTALRIDTVGAGLKATQDEIARLQAGLAAAPDHATAATEELGRALDMARDKLKQLGQQRADPGGLGRDLLQQDQDALTHYDNAFRGSEQARLAGHLAMLRDMLSNDQLNAAQRFKLQQDLEASQKSLYDSQTKAGTKAATDTLSASLAGFEGQIRALEDHTRAVIDHLNAEVKLKQIGEAAKSAAALKALADESKAVDALFAKELALANLPALKKQEITNKQTGFDDSNALQAQQTMEKAAEASQKAWDAAFKEINGAFDSQINGLLRGTESWGQAFKNVLATLTEDLIKFFVNWTLQQTENFTRDIVMGNARVTAHVTGNAEMAASDTGAAAAGGLAWLGNALKAIEADAAQVFGGVFAFLAPVMGPGAAGPASGASAAVVAAGGAIASADIGMWQVPGDMLTLVHHNELVMPAAQAGAFRSLLSGDGGAGARGSVAIHPTVHINTNALDGASVDQFFRNNQRGLMRTIDEAVRHGAHLGLRSLTR